MGPINEKLFLSLKRVFGKVRISNEGQRYLGRHTRDPVTGRERIITIDPGEHYSVNCPFCHDQRGRFYVSHKWNTVDEAKKVFGRGLINCFNEDCLHKDEGGSPIRDINWDRVCAFEDILKPYIKARPRIIRPLDMAINSDLTKFKEVQLPGVCLSLNMLAPTHPARQYIVNRGFDVEELCREWNVQYCDRHEHPYIRGRIIIPVYYDGKIVGWQARAITAEHDGPKYFTMPGLNKSRMLFNQDRAKKYDFGVVVEGVFDAFRVGPRAVALLGKSMNAYQQTLVHLWWSNGAVCLLLDPDAVEDMEHLSKLMQSKAYRWGAFSVTLPENNDPADMPRDELWGIIAAYARNRGIKLVDCPGRSGPNGATVQSAGHSN